MTARPTISTNTHVRRDTVTTVTTLGHHPHVHVGESAQSAAGSVLFFEDKDHLIDWAQDIIKQVTR
jgi:hypothetical protein